MKMTTLKFKFYSVLGDRRYNVSISKYTKEPSLMQSHIKGKNLLISCNMNEVQRLQKR